ncbi:MAG: hypothetical protein R3240_14350, partial [Gammaproteobacteria bacterium]|nr:hypothetical protein [Gammaproteobacteria bacterium]
MTGKVMAKYLTMYLAILSNLFFIQATCAADNSRVALTLPENLSITAGERFSFSVVLLTPFQFSGPT